MLIKHGIAVSPGIAIGPAFVLGAEDFRIPEGMVSVAAVDSELDRLHAAIESVSEEINANKILAEQTLGKEYAAIFGAHLQLIRDPKLIRRIEELIRDEQMSPEYAASKVLRGYAKSLQNLGNKYLAERSADIFDLERSLLRNLLGEQREELSHLTTDVIVLAHNLTPSETTSLNRDFVQGFATEIGGSTSHTAILAGALEIPAIVGINDFLTDVSGGDMIILDGDDGRVIIEPDDATLARYEALRTKYKSHVERLWAQGTGPASTKDGTEIKVFGNIEFPYEAEHCKTRGADGIGLYRTEFLYMGSSQERSGDDHYEAYSEVLKAFPDQPVTIRTLDVGADKIPGVMRHAFNEDSNRELGLRSIRVSLEYVDLFKTQLRAIMRAAVHGDVRVMFPLISTISEFRQAKMVFRDVREDLEEQGIAHRGDIPVGMMVEVPSAAILAKEFAPEVDFFSIGTNDLIQYTLAADRSDPKVAKYYNAADPAVLLLIINVLEAAKNADIPVTVCGQMSSDPKYVPLLAGMGLRQFSATPQSIPLLKQVIRNLTIEEGEAIVKRVRELELARDISAYLRGELKRFLDKDPAESSDDLE